MNKLEEREIIEAKKAEEERKLQAEFRVPKDADWELVLPARYAEMYEKMVRDLRKKNPEEDPLLEMQIRRIAEQRVFYLIMLNFETSANFEIDEPMLKVLATGEVSFRTIYARIRQYMGQGYDPQKHSKQIDDMLRQFMAHTESGKREFGRIKAFVDGTIRIINYYLNKLQIDKAVVMKMKEEIGKLVEKTVR